MSQRNVPVWVVAYKVTEDGNWSIRRDLAGPGHAADIAAGMLSGGHTRAVALCGELVVDIPDAIVSDKPLGDATPTAEEQPKAEKKV